MGTFWSLKLLPMVPDIIRTGARMTTPTLQELDGDLAALNGNLLEPKIAPYGADIIRHWSNNDHPYVARTRWGRCSA